MTKVFKCTACGISVLIDENEKLCETCPACGEKDSLYYSHDLEEELAVTKPDMVNHPPHYQSDGGIEVIDVIKAFVKDLKGIQAAAAANVIKYICRWKNKDGLRDLKKAEWYLKLLIKDVKQSQKENN